MKILVISAHYPPYHSGGYEIRIKNIVDELAQRDHLIHVITSKIPRKTKKNDSNLNYSVIRKLHEKSQKKDWIVNLTMHSLTRLFGSVLVFIRQLIHDIFDLRVIDHEIMRFHPDIIYLGHILPLTKTLLPFLADCHKPIILDDGGATLLYSHQDKGLWFKFIEGDLNNFPINLAIVNILRKIIGTISKYRLKPAFKIPENIHIIFKREANLIAVRAAGIPFNHAVVLPSGVDAHLFKFLERDALSLPIRIIYPARIEPRKGQLDALALLSQLTNTGFDTQLTLVGEARSSYMIDIQEKINLLDISSYLKVVPMIPHEELVSLYHQADICFFPSLQKQGLSRVPLEAMACGCVVISYGNEGSNEIIRDNENGFLVSIGDYDAVIAIIKELIANSQKFTRITTQARNDVENKYDLKEYVGKIEETILEFIKGN